MKRRGIILFGCGFFSLITGMNIVLKTTVASLWEAKLKHGSIAQKHQTQQSPEIKKKKRAPWKTLEKKKGAG